MSADKEAHIDCLEDSHRAVFNPVMIVYFILF